MFFFFFFFFFFCKLSSQKQMMLNFFSMCIYHCIEEKIENILTDLEIAVIYYQIFISGQQI